MRQRAVMELLNPCCGELVLDVGCGNARDVIPFARKGAICVGVDFSIGMLREGKKDIDQGKHKNADLILASANHLPFKEDTFDKVSCSEVIEHISNYQGAIAEVKRILKKEGKLVITTPNSHSLYGAVRKVLPPAFGAGSTILRRSRLKKRCSGNKLRHPYDKWKTQKEVIRAVEESGFSLCQKVGVCFIPSQLTYYLPSRFKVAVVRVSSIFENRFRYLLTASGYIIAMSALKWGKRNDEGEAK